MKKKSKQSKAKQPVVPAKPIEPEVVEQTALTVTIGSIEFPAGVESLGDKANFLHAYSVEAGKRSTAAAILAGWVLSVARESCAHGMWYSWLEKNVAFSKRTADNYMSLFAQTVGAARVALRRPVALSVMPTMKELEAAAHDVDGKSLSALYKSTRLMAVNPDHGGDRREKAAKNGHVVGRPKKKDADVAAELKAVTEHESVLWASAKGALDTLVQLDSKRGVFQRLSNDHLAQVSKILADLSTKAAKAIEQRIMTEAEL